MYDTGHFVELILILFAWSVYLQHQVSLLTVNGINISSYLSGSHSLAFIFVTSPELIILKQAISTENNRLIKEISVLTSNCQYDIKYGQDEKKISSANVFRIAFFDTGFTQNSLHS